MKLPNAEDLKPYPAMKNSGVEWIGDAPKRQRRSIRLQGYDYTRQGAYFVTICTRNRACLLGDIVEGRMHLSEAGRLAQVAWEDLPHHYPHVQIDVWVIMPNHMHGIVILTEAQATDDDMPVGAAPKTDVGAGFKPAPTRHGLPEIVRACKTFSARRINACTIPSVRRSGNAITTNTLSETNPRWIGFGNTLRITRPDGRKT